MEILSPQNLPFLHLLGPLALGFLALTARREPGLRPKAVLRMVPVAVGMALLSAALAGGALLLHGETTSPLLGVAGFGLSFRLDALAVTMTILVAFIAAIVLRFSGKALDGDPRQGLFLGELALTAATVLLLVSAGNVVQLAAAWFATSMALQRLLTFHRDRPRALAAARKKFVIARMADVALLIAVVLIVRTLGSTDIGQILDTARRMIGEGATSFPLMIAALLLALAAVLKSAQFPAHLWLPESMETPTPVSALLHAGVVNAGGFLILRLADVVILAPYALTMLLVLGGITAVFGSLVMTLQTSVKVRLAWSTIAQMGLMIFQCGLGAFAMAVLHIVAHSLYKAHAFLSSGNAVAEIRSAPARSLPAPRALPLLLGLIVATAIIASLGVALGIDFTEKPGALVLLAVFVLGLAPTLGSVFGEPASTRLRVRTLWVAAGLAALYLSVSTLVSYGFSESFPLDPRDDSTRTAIALTMVALLAAVAFFPSFAPRLLRSERWGRLRVHARQGFYLSVLLNRLLDIGRQEIARTPSKGLDR